MEINLRVLGHGARLALSREIDDNKQPASLKDEQKSTLNGGGGLVREKGNGTCKWLLPRLRTSKLLRIPGQTASYARTNANLNDASAARAVDKEPSLIDTNDGFQPRNSMSFTLAWEKIRVLPAR